MEKKFRFGIFLRRRISARCRLKIAFESEFNPAISLLYRRFTFETSLDLALDDGEKEILISTCSFLLLPLFSLPLPLLPLHRLLLI